MDQLMDILTEVNADVDFETCDTLIDDGILDSFDIVSIVVSLMTHLILRLHLLTLFLRILILQRQCGR